MIKMTLFSFPFNSSTIILTVTAFATTVLSSTAYVCPHTVSKKLSIFPSHIAPRTISRRATTSTTHVNLFGNLFGDNTKDYDDQKDLQENEIARFSNLSAGSDDDIHVKFDSLSIMISEWSRLFVDEEDSEISGFAGKRMGLTTPVTVVPLVKLSFDVGDVVEGFPAVTELSGVQLLFKKPKVGGRSAYKDKDEDEDHADGENAEESIKEGGVEVQVQKLSNGELQVSAKRCEIEEGTMIKEMSEQTILDSLRDAIRAWKKEQKS